jgi:hypothetical protein
MTDSDSDHDDPGGATMHFGRWRGYRVADVPTPYLAWCVRECDCLGPRLLEAIRAELLRRGERPNGRRRKRRDEGPRAGYGYRTAGGDGAAVPCPKCERARDVAAAGYRQLAMACHPDRGGDDKLMSLVNETYERLQEALR